VKGEGQLVDHFSCPRFKDYMNEQEHRLTMPNALQTPDDWVQEFDITDTPTSEKFQKEVEEHYANLVKCSVSSKPR
jgi:hypothetical protein